MLKCVKVVVTVFAAGSTTDGKEVHVSVVVFQY
jgi:hypothetical protein